MLETFFQSPAKKILSKYKEQVDKINALENNLIDLTDTELREQTNQLRKRLLAGEAKKFYYK
jgi:preprotein translocase subunit SecA